MRLPTIVLSLAIIATFAVPSSARQAAPEALRSPDVIYVPTPQEVVDAMLVLAEVSADDVVYDLGSGDGRTPITAARTYGARGVGIDIDPERVKEANENLRTADVADKVRFLNQDLFTSDISEATVVTLYLLPSLNLKLIPQAQRRVEAGYACGVARIRHGRDPARSDSERKRPHDLSLDGPYSVVAEFAWGPRGRSSFPGASFCC